MPSYIRSKSPGDTYFFTARGACRGTDLFVRHVDVLRRAVVQTKARYPFVIDDIVVLPDVIHCMWTLPVGDADFSRRWRMLKSQFSRHVDAPHPVDGMRLRPGEKGLWQRRFWEHVIRNPEDMAVHRHMIFSAPVQAGLVNRPEQWPHSSVHRAIARGQYDVNAPVGVAYRAAPSVGRTARAPYGTASHAV
ncbi:MAG: transposase [Pseudomonadota bacterium]